MRDTASRFASSVSSRMFSLRAASISMRSTLMPPTRKSCRLTSACGFSRNFASSSRPRRPRARLVRSPLSASFCSSSTTNCGTTSGASMNPVAASGSSRPSISTLVSTTHGRTPRRVRENSTYGITRRRSSLVVSTTLMLR